MRLKSRSELLTYDEFELRLGFGCDKLTVATLHSGDFGV